MYVQNKNLLGPTLLIIISSVVLISSSIIILCLLFMILRLADVATLTLRLVIELNLTVQHLNLGLQGDTVILPKEQGTR